MEKVSVNPCVQNRLYNYNNCQIQQNAPINNVGIGFNTVGNTVTDTLNIRSKKEIQLEKLNKLFPNGGFDKLCQDINKDFGIDKPAEIKLVGDSDGIRGGGFTFEKNEITLSLGDLLDSDTKIVGIKNGKRTVLVSPIVKLPLFVDKKSAEEFVKMQSQNGNLGFDQLIAEPVTENEQRKFITQKVSHEIIHSQQHMIIRKTEGMGEKEIIKAWTHEKPKNLIENYILNLKTENLFNKSYWKNQPKTEQQIKKDSPAGYLAKTWLEAIRNYPPVDSPEYTKNPIEVDAYMRSAQYAARKYGAWS